MKCNRIDAQKDKAGKSWAALLAGYDRVSKLNHEEDSRLFKLVGGYIAAVVAIASWLVPHLQGGKDIPSFILSVASVASSYYVVFYSYHSVHLSLSAHYLNALATAARHHVGIASDALRWEAYSSAGGKGWTRSVLVYLKTSWRLAPVVLAGFLAYFAHESARGAVELWVARGAGALAVATLVAAFSSVYIVARSNIAQKRHFPLSLDTGA